MNNSKLSALRQRIREMHCVNESELLEQLKSRADIPQAVLSKAVENGAKLVQAVRADDKPGLMEVFLAEYGLSTDEGVALMCLAEALLRVPDSDTIDDLIEDKIAPSKWGEHLGRSSSSLVNTATWALMLTGKVLDDDESDSISSTLHSAVKRLGEPIIRVAVKRAMKEMGNQFVLGETIQNAISRGDKRVKEGYTYSYDMLGEMALTKVDASLYFEAYKDSILQLAKRAKSNNIEENPGISVKLSALHPRYEAAQCARILDELSADVIDLAVLAKDANMGFNIDAEESERLDISLDIIEKLFADERLNGWDGLGIVVQAYSKRASAVIDWLYAMAEEYDRRLMVRLVKGAYWDSEIKRAQIEGLEDFPVFTAKSATDVSYICCAKQLIDFNGRIYPQFATHNAHSVAAVQALADGKRVNYEFQRLHGMGETLYRQVKAQGDARCRIYAPVGKHRDLLAYLVRRLLENGANSSFVNQIVDESISPETIAADPFAKTASDIKNSAEFIDLPAELYKPKRSNSKGWDLDDALTLQCYEEERKDYQEGTHKVYPLMVSQCVGTEQVEILNPFDHLDRVAKITNASQVDVEAALNDALPWTESTNTERAAVLNKAADLYENNTGLFSAILAREAGKTGKDVIGEIREAVDFLRYYASQIQEMEEGEPQGVFVCISPWNFPLAIFTGQIAAALAAGNSVIAKPAESTPVIASYAIQMLHQAGVPTSALQLLLGEGKTVGAQLVSDARINGVCFTGSTNTAMLINRAMAANAPADATLIAETGGLNAMVVDSTALPEQAVRDIVTSAFQSAGQRCSALRVLYVQEDIADAFLKMLYGAMDELVLGDPWEITTDVGPVISEQAREQIQNYIDQAQHEGRLLKQLAPASSGYSVAPCAIKVKGINDIESEVFGPVLHIATFRHSELGQVLADINQRDYGLTFGIHSRIDDRVDLVANTINAGNIYVNRNQIGAVVGSQPFGGENLSGTGPKAGGPHYVKRFLKQARVASLASKEPAGSKTVPTESIQEALNGIHPLREAISSELLPGPTGESNCLSIYPRGRVLCLGPSSADAEAQAQIVRGFGCEPIIICEEANSAEAFDGKLTPEQLGILTGFELVVFWGDQESARPIRQALADRDGPLIALAMTKDLESYCLLERHVCVDTTASGGNASLLAAAS